MKEKLRDSFWLELVLAVIILAAVIVLTSIYR